MEIEPFYDQSTGTISYIVSDPATSEAAFIDPVLDYDGASAQLSTRSVDTMMSYAHDKGLTVTWCLETHIHADHLSAADYVREKTAAKIGIGEKVALIQVLFKTFYNLADDEVDITQFDRLFCHEDTFKIGHLVVSVMHTPGHTPACVTYLVGDAAFVGDTIFMPDYGTARTDFPGGDARTLYRSIQSILSLPTQTRIFVGHDYLPEGRQSPAWVSNVDKQKTNNIHVNDTVSEEYFINLRQTRDATLTAPALILPSLQVNIRAGKLFPAESDGHQYLKIPINKLATPVK